MLLGTFSNNQHPQLVLLYFKDYISLINIHLVGLLRAVLFSLSDILYALILF